MECALTQVVVTHVDVWKAMKERDCYAQVSYSKAYVEPQTEGVPIQILTSAL